MLSSVKEKAQTIMAVITILEIFSRHCSLSKADLKSKETNPLTLRTRAFQHGY